MTTKTDDITLPTTPNRTLLRRVMPDDYRYGDIYGYTVEQMRGYARAAVEADRAQRVVNQSLTTEQEAFEAWAIAHPRNWSCVRSASGGYSHSTVKLSWDTWQARAALAQEKS